MGGMFAQQLYDCKKIIVNPAFHVSRTMRKQIGICPFLNPRKDSAITYTITPNSAIVMKRWNTVSSTE